MVRKIFIALGILLLWGGIAYVSWVLLPVPHASSPSSSTPVPCPQLPSLGGPFRLKDAQGKEWTEKDFPGRYLVVYFGYTFCPDICPMALHNLTDAFSHLTATGYDKERGLLQPLFITLDPERDTPSLLEDFMSQFDSRFLGLTGSPEAIEGAVKSYRVYRAKFVPDPHKKDYLLDHSSLVYVIDPQGHYKGSFSHTTPPEEMAAYLRAWVSSPSSSGASS